MPRVSCTLDARVSRGEKDFMDCSTFAEEWEPLRKGLRLPRAERIINQIKGPPPLLQKPPDSHFWVTHSMPNDPLGRADMSIVL